MFMSWQSLSFQSYLLFVCLFVFFSQKEELLLRLLKTRA